MKRIIKFKVFNAITNKLIGYERINDQGHWEFQKVNRVDHWLLGINTSEDDLIRQQFTGRYSLNNEEIYVGDVDVDGGTIEWSLDTAQFVINYPGIEVQEMLEVETWFKHKLV